VPLEQAVPKVHELLPPQQGSPFEPQCWHVLPGPNGFCLQTFWKPQADTVAQHG
jgi:hypothetical protein